jgi:hypothetical protein
VNHSASAQLFITSCASALPALAFSATSWKKSNISRVFFRPWPRWRQRGVVQQLDQRLDVVAADHGAEQLGGLGLGDQADLDVAMRHGGQEDWP